jgi:hypothetical protein
MNGVQKKDQANFTLVHNKTNMYRGKKNCVNAADVKSRTHADK